MNNANIRKFEEQYVRLIQEFNTYKKKLDESKKVLHEMKRELLTTNENLENESEMTAKFTETAMTTHKSIREVSHNMNRIEKEIIMLGRKMLMKIQRDQREKEEKYQ